MPSELFSTMLSSLRAELGAGWGRPRKRLGPIARLVREAVQEMDGVHVAAELDQDAQRGVRIQLWADRDDFDLLLADDIVHETLRALGDREILVVCRSFEEDGIHYRFASGTVDAGLIGQVNLVGPYARDAAHLARIGTGQPVGFSA